MNLREIGRGNFGVDAYKSGSESRAGFCEHCNEHSCSI
jgi:hypothetical protein